MWLAPSVFWILNQWHNNLLNIFNSLNCSYTVNFLTKFIFNAAWSLSGQFLWHSICFPGIFTTFYLFSDLNSYIYVLNLPFNLIFMHCYGQYVSGSISDEQKKRTGSAIHFQVQVHVVCTQLTWFHRLSRPLAWAFHTAAINVLIFNLFVVKQWKIFYYISLCHLHRLTILNQYFFVLYVPKFFNSCLRPTKTWGMPPFWEVSFRIAKDRLQA